MLQIINIKLIYALPVVTSDSKLLLLDAVQTRCMTSQHDVTDAVQTRCKGGANAVPPHADKRGVRARRGLAPYT